jgi:hypothetical protein
MVASSDASVWRTTRRIHAKISASIETGTALSLFGLQPLWNERQ